MLTIRTLNRRVALGAIALALTGIGADAPTQTIDAGGLTFQAPAAWKASKPRNAMRRAQLTIAPVKGDEDPAELIVFAFGGGGGSTAANVERWRAYFKDAEGNKPKAETKTVKGKNVDVTRVETGGHYVAAVSPGSPETHDKPNYHLLGGMIQAGGTGYYLRLIGPAKTVAAARPAFDELLASVKAEDK